MLEIPMLQIRGLTVAYGHIEALQKNGEAIPQEHDRSPVSLGLVIDVPMLV